MNTDLQPPTKVRSISMLLAGALWIGFALFLLAFALQYALNGSGSQPFGFTSIATSVLLGWVQVMGFLLAAALCASIGIALCSFGLIHATDRDIERRE